MREKFLGTVIITLFLAETMFIFPTANFSEIQNSKDSVMPEYEFIPDDMNGILSSTPRAFTANHGQLENDEVLFYSQGGDVWFTDDGVWFELREEIPIKSPGSRVGSRESDEWFDPMRELEPPEPMEYRRVILKQEFVGANHVRPVGRERCSWNSNFFYGNDSTKWCPNVPNYREVFYENLYDGIDLRYYTNEKGLKYDFIVHPGADVAQIRLKYKSADGLEIVGTGNLIIKTPFKDVMDGELFIYQEFEGIRNQVKGKFVMYNNLEYGFGLLESYNEQEVLVIDPNIKLEFSTFIGGSGLDCGWDLAIDQIGNLYVTGFTNSQDFPNTPGAYDQSYNGDFDIFVIKLNQDYITLYSTYIGGASNEDPTIAVESNGNAIISGRTFSGGFPTTPGAYDRIFKGYADVFVLKLESSGSKLLYSTFIGGTGHESAGSITIDSQGNAFVTGGTNSSDFPTTPGGYNRSYNCDNEAFIFKLNQTGSKLIYSTYIGGKKSEGGSDIAIDSMGNAYVTGTTNSSDFPTTAGAIDTSFNGILDIFVLKLNQNGTSLIYSTYFGGKNEDWGFGISLDSMGNVYITGQTNSSDFPNTTGAYDQTYNSNQYNDYDGYIFKLNHNGSKLIFSTFIGGTDFDRTIRITYDLTGNLYVVGDTYSTDFPITDDAFNSTINAGDIFLIKLSSNGSNLLYSTFIGGSGYEFSKDIASDSIGNVFLTGMTSSLDFPNTTGKFNGGTWDAFLSQFSVPKNININSLSLIFNDTSINQVYSRLDTYTFRINITDPLSLTDLGIVRLNLDPFGTNIQLLWNRANGQFLKSNDPNNFITLESSSNAINKHIYRSLYQWTIYFNITFNWNYPDEKLHDVQAYATSAILSPAWFNATGLYCVENDLVFNGTLSVNNENNRTIADGELVRGGEKLNWTGFKVVYENTTNVCPPNEEYNVTLWNAQGCIGYNSSSSGMNFTIRTVTAKNTNINGDIHIINLSGIPPECDKTNVTFIIRIDGDNVTFSNATPDNTTWQTTSEVNISINITDIGGGLVNGSSVMYSLSTDNGETWNDWQTFPELQSKVSVEPEDIIIFNDGTNNLIKWQAKDSVGNGPVESPVYQLLVDTEIVKFSNASPLSTNVSTTEEVEVGITIIDKTSGVNASSIEYKISTDSGQTWTSWIPVSGLSNEKVINITLKLTFPNGTVNRIKWRASDVAGNGPTESEVNVICVNTWVEKVIVLIPNVKLWSPPNGSVISSTAIELSWQLLNTKIPNVHYNIYLDTAYPPVKINQSRVINTTVIIDNLSNGLTYYWTVMPRTTTINGTCESGVWSFTFYIPIPKIHLISPENNSIINNSQPLLSWAVEYDGTEILRYNVYFGTSKNLELEFKNHPSTICFIRERLVAGETYYWKVEPWAGNIQGPTSETWSFTVKKDNIPHFELELFVSPPVVELPPGGIERVRAIVRNLGELEDPILLRVEVPPDLGVGAMVDEPCIISAIPNATAEFYITVTTSMDPQEDEIKLTVVAVSRRATEYELTVEDKAELTVKILTQEKKDDDEPWLSLSEFWIIFLIIIIILIVMIIVWTFLRQKKSAQESKEESTAEDALTVKPGTVPKAVISVGEAAQTVTQPQLSETTGYTESGQQTQAIAKVHTLAASTTPGQVPETHQIPQAAEVPQLPAAELDTAETVEESSEETTPELNEPMETQEETDQST